MDDEGARRRIEIGRRRRAQTFAVLSVVLPVVLPVLLFAGLMKLAIAAAPADPRPNYRGPRKRNPRFNW